MMTGGSGVGRAGAVLLEVLLSLVIFAGGALAVLNAVDQGTRALHRVRESERAADLARSAMAKLEAGITTPEELRGPVPAWGPDYEDVTTEEVSLAIESGGFRDSPPEESGWELEIDTEPTVFEGLSRVHVRAVRRAPGFSGRELASYSLHQLVRLVDVADTVGEEEDGLTGPEARDSIDEFGGTGGAER